MGEPTDRFHVLVPRWIGGARLFKIYLKRGAVYGAYVGGQSRGIVESIALFGEFTLFLPSAIRIDRALEARYDRVDSSRLGFLQADRRNFRITGAETARVSFTRVRRWWLPKPWRRVTLVRFERRGDGEPLPLIVKREDARSLRHALEREAFRVEEPEPAFGRGPVST